MASLFQWKHDYFTVRRRRDLLNILTLKICDKFETSTLTTRLVWSIQRSINFCLISITSMQPRIQEMTPLPSRSHYLLKIKNQQTPSRTNANIERSFFSLRPGRLPKFSLLRTFATIFFLTLIFPGNFTIKRWWISDVRNAKKMGGHRLRFGENLPGRTPKICKIRLL